MRKFLIVYMASVIFGLSTSAQPSYNVKSVNNPYVGVDFTKYYKSNFHTHTTESDGSATPVIQINAMASAGYDIYAITDHDYYGTPGTTWPWTTWITETPSIIYANRTAQASAFYPDLGADGVFAIRGNELSWNDHVVSLFSEMDFFTANPSGTYTTYGATAHSDDGFLIFAHPCDYDRPASWYNDYFNDYYGTWLGIEVITARNTDSTNSYYNSVQELWDAINYGRHPDSLMWGFADLDRHSNLTGFRNYNHHFLTSLTEDALKENLRNGAFTFSLNENADLSGTVLTPMLTGVTVDGSRITLTASDCDGIQWYDNTSKLILTGNSVDVNAHNTNFVRAVLFNEHGRTFTQPFGVEVENLLSGAYWCAPWGNDTNGDGSFDDPWFTLTKAAAYVTAGDTVIFRGGTYNYTSGTDILNKNGTADNPICFFNYPGETPVFDYSGWKLTGDDNAIYIANSDYIHFKGITVCNVKQAYDQNFLAGIRTYDCLHLKFTQMVVHHIQGKGFRIYNCSADIINCDAYRCADPLRSDSFPGNGGTGFNVGSDTSTELAYYIYGCRSWENADQGFSGAGYGNAVYENCWAWNMNPDGWTGPGLGSGFKFGLTSTQMRTFTVKNSIAAYCPHAGFNSNMSITYVPNNEYWYNNTAYECNTGFSLGEGASGYDPVEVTIRNNITYSVDESYSGDHYNYLDASYRTDDHNSWNSGITLTSGDFVSVDTAQLRRPRKADGSLPDISFGQLVSTSDLIDAGIDVGSYFYGTAPDLGYSEHISGVQPPSNPVFLNAVVEYVTPSRLDLVYNLTLANIIPATSAFTVRVNSVTRNVTMVAISGTKVLLTLASPVIYNDIVTVAYTKPSTNPVQTTAGGQAASITAQNVTNNVAASSPVYVSSVIENATPSRIEMTYNIALASIIPATSAFTVRVNSVTRNVTVVAISGTKVLLTLASPVIYNDIVTVAYTKPSTNPVQTTAGGQAASITAQNVTNNVAASSPVYVSSVIENATPSRIEITYNIALASIIPATSAFTVRVNSVTRNVTVVAISGTKVLLTLASPVIYNDIVTVAYTKPSTNPVQTTAGGQAASITAQNVTNNVSTSSPVYVSSVIENATPSRIEITYNIALASIIPATSAFTVRVNSVTRNVTVVAISGTKVLLTLASPVIYNDIVTVAYTKPSTNPVQTTAGGQAASITAQNVTNNVAASSPVYVSSVIENATPSRIEITYNIALASIIPATSAFTVRVNSVTRNVTVVAISGTKVLLTLASPVIYNDIVTVAYTKPSTNPIQTIIGGQAVSITDQGVMNNCAAPTPNQNPTVNISSPTKSTSFISPATITIDADANDPDGTIAKVEFFNGTTKLGEKTSAPYSFTWKEVTDGTYYITALAIDNQGAWTVSSAVSVTVLKSSSTINHLPSVNISSPGQNKKLKKHDNILIEVEAFDPDGSISKVELKSGDITLIEMTTAPYIYIWEDVDTGRYEITAIATDDLGGLGYSTSVEINVGLFSTTFNSDNINLYPNPNNGHFTIDILSGLLSQQKNRITVFDLSGKTIYNEIFNGDGNIKEIDLVNSKLDPGSYILMITSGSTIVATKKFIIN